MSGVRALQEASTVVHASGDDIYVRCSLPPGRPVVGWVLRDDPDSEAVAWTLPDRGSGWLTAIGTPAGAARLVQAAANSGTTLRALTVPQGTVPLLPARLQPVRPEDWDWFWTDRIGPPLPGEDRVCWLGPADEPADENEIASLLDTDSPRHSARPGERYVRRWCGIRDGAGVLVACAAHVEYVAGVPHLASIATRRAYRGGGLGSAITAWLTRQLLAQGAPVVTLGMYADNEVARRLYERLGYRLAHRFTSGHVLRPLPWS